MTSNEYSRLEESIEYRQEKVKKLFRDLLPLTERDSEDYDIQLDDNIQKVFNNNPPDFISNSKIFSPLIVGMDKFIEDKIFQIGKRQTKLAKLIDIKTFNDKQQPREKDIDDLKEEIKARKSSIEKLRSAPLQEISQMNANTINSYDQALLRYRKNYEDIQNEINELDNTYQQCQDELNKTVQTNDMFKAQLDQSSKTLTNYKKMLVQLKITLRDLNKNRQQLFKRGQDLAALITQYQLTKTNQEKEIRKLEEQYQEHQQLIVSYKMLEDKIKEQGKQQEVALNKMVNAVELTESAVADSQKNRMTRDNYAEELKRLKDLIANTTKQFDVSFAEHEKLIRKHFETALKSINERSLILESENSQYGHEKDSLQRQIDTASQENSILKASKSDNGFSLFVERMSALKAEIEAAYGKKEQLTAMNEKAHDNIDDIKSRLLTNSTNTRNDTLELTQRSQKLEMELEMHKSTCKEIMEKNAKLTAENQKLRNEIVQIQRSASTEAQSRLNEKDNELAEVKIQFEETSKANQKAISEMQQAVLAFQQHADKWKCKAQSIGLEASDAKQNKESHQQELIDQINELESSLAERKQLKAKTEFMLQQMDQQVKSLKQQISEAEKKQKQNAAVIQKTITQQNQIANDINKNKAMLDKLHVQVKRNQRNLGNAKTFMNNYSEYSDDI